MKLPAPEERPNMKIAVSAGHHPNAQGASNGTLTEYAVAAAMAGRLVMMLSLHGHQAHLVCSVPLKRKVELVNEIGPNVAIEFHLNAGGGQGCETLYCPGSVTGKKIATAVQRGIIAATGFRDRGEKEGWYKMVLPPDPQATPDYFLSGTRCPAIIIEPYFIDTEAEKGAVFVNEIVAGVVAGLARIGR